MLIDSGVRKPKEIRIDYELFVDLYVYACRNSDYSDLQFKRLHAGVRRKLEAMMRHDLYSLYKTGATQEERARARQEYLDAIGLPGCWQWTEETDATVTRTPFDWSMV